jgi:PAS domain S-box-containing protein
MNANERAADTKGFDHSFDSVILTSGDGAIRHANPAACAQFGYSLEEFVTLSWNEVADPSAARRVGSVLAFARKDGSRFSAETSSAQFTASTGEQLRITFVRNVTERERSSDVLHAANSELERLIELAPDGMVIVDRTGCIVFINQQVERMFGFERADLIGKTVEALVPNRLSRNHVEHRIGFQRDPHPRGMGVGLELFARRRDGSEFPVEISLSPIQTREGPLIVSAIRDVSDRKAAEAARLQLAAAVESSNDAIITKTLSSIITTWNAAAERMFGYQASEAIGQPIQMLIPETATDEEIRLMARLLRGERIDSYETRWTRKDGTVIYVSLTLSPIRNASGTIVGVSTIARDVTAHRIAQNQTEASLREKEVLLREVHHRVKNNLQTVSSLLNLQAQGTRDEKTACVLRESESRVHAMALIHQTLYQSGNLAEVDFAEYLRQVTAYVMRTFGMDTGRIRAEFDTASAGLTLDSGIPCGLATQELVSNSLKHAFPDGRSGAIKISFHRVEDHVILKVADDGIGITPGLDLVKLDSLGLRLVAALAKQLNAELRIERLDRGTSVSLRFREK